MGPWLFMHNCNVALRNHFGERSIKHSAKRKNKLQTKTNHSLLDRTENQTRELQ